MGFKSNEALSVTETTKLKAFFDQGLKVLQDIENRKTEIKDIKGGLSDTGKQLAEELEVEPALLMKALNTAHKASMDEERAAIDTVEEMLAAVGRA
jgi:hypothetical protein